MIGALAASLVQMAPLPRLIALPRFLFGLTVVLLLLSKAGPLSLIFGGALVGVLSKGKAWERLHDIGRLLPI